MRGTGALLPAKNKLKQIYPSTGTLSNLISSALKRGKKDDFGGEEPITNEKTDPIVAFSKPPPLPPVLGPLVAFSLLEAWLRRDNDED